MAKPIFTKKVVGEVINNIPPGAMNTFSTVGDINGDKLLDIVIGGRRGKIVWLENCGPDKEWKQHIIDEFERMECGGGTYDITGNGLPDVFNGGDAGVDEIYWWENPGVTGKKWQRRVVAKTSHNQFHDTTIGDITGDGVMSLIFDNQRAPGGTAIYRVPFPKDYKVSPWAGIELIATGKVDQNPYRKEGVQPEEGLAVGDIDGDGKNELVCGTHWYKYVNGKWESHKFTTGYLSTKVAIGDVNGDGMNEIILSEGDPCIYGKRQGGKVSWFKPKDDINAMWEENVIEDFLLDAHSLQLGNICCNGKLDIFVGEIGVADKDDNYAIRPPRLLVFENDGKAGFTRHVIDEGTGTHDALLRDMRNKGFLDIVGKPLHGAEKWHVHVWYNEGENVR